MLASSPISSTSGRDQKRGTIASVVRARPGPSSATRPSSVNAPPETLKNITKTSGSVVRERRSRTSQRRSAARGRSASVCHREAHFLPEREFEGVAVRIREKRPVTHRVAGIDGTEPQRTLPTRFAAKPVHLLSCRTADTKVGEGRQRPLDVRHLDEHDHEGSGAVRKPHHTEARGGVLAPVHHLHPRVFAIESDVRFEISGGQRDMCEADVSHPNSLPG